MNTKNKYITYSIIALFLIFCGLFAIFHRNPINDTRTIFHEEKTAIEGRIEKLRKEREEKRVKQEALYTAWKQEDETLSGAINHEKIRLEGLTLYLSGRIDTSVSLIPKAHAMENDFGTAHDTPASVDTRGSNTPHCAIGTGSHDVRSLAHLYPGVAGWKNNNTSGITLGSKALEKAFDNAGIKWFVGTARPKNEGSHYYGFPDLENGLKAKLLIIRRSYKNHTISSYLTKWGTDEIPTTLPGTRNIGSLNDSELLSLLKSQIQKESGKAMSDYIFNNVIICEQ